MSEEFIELKQWSTLRNLIITKYKESDLTPYTIHKNTGCSFYNILYSDHNRPRIDKLLMWCRYFRIRIYIKVEK